MDKTKFIVTNNKDTYDLLIHLGYQFISKNGGEWFFVNEPEKFVFGNIDDVHYTNILHI